MKIITIFFLVLILPALCSSLEIEDHKGILSLKLAEETVISPNIQTLQIEISKPALSTPKEFELKLTLLGPAFFEDNKKDKTIIYEDITSKKILNETIIIQSSASTLGEIINLNYDYKYKSSSFGKIDEDFTAYSGVLSFKGAASSAAYCEQELQKSKSEIIFLNSQLEILNNSMTNIPVDWSQQISNCQTKLDLGSKMFLGVSILCVVFLLTASIFSYLWFREKRKNNKQPEEE